MPSLHYLFYNDKHRTIEIFQNDGGLELSSQIGENLFSFISLDLSDYEKVRLDLQNDSEYINDTSLVNKVLNKYPEIIRRLNGIDNLDEATDSEFTDHIKDSFINLLISNNNLIHNHSEILEHPYMKYSDLFIAGTYYNFETFLYRDANLELIQYVYKQALPFCFDIEYNSFLNELTAYQRYYLFINLYPLFVNRIESTVNYSIIHQPFTQNNDDIYDLPRYKSGIIENSSINQELIDHIKNINPTYMHALDCGTPKCMAFNEFRFMLAQNISIKKCKNCGNYFILKGDYSTDYCDRIPNNERYTCKKIAAINARKNKLKSNPILKEYEKAYKRNYARYNNHKMTEDEFRTWVETATIQRDLYDERYENSPSQDIINKFKNFLGNK